MSRWLVTGAGGMLGREMARVLAGRDVTAADHAALDVTDAVAVDAAIPGHDVVVNCAGWTAVDAAEADEPAAFELNALAPAVLARACARHGAALVHLSTDYVFAGTARTPYREGDPVAPRSAYGRTKAAGEWAVRAELPHRHWIVRTAWLYGRRGPSFVHTMARLQAERDVVDVVDDQRGQPTWTSDVAERIVALVDAGAPGGIYHATSSGQTTWCGLARAVFELLGADPQRVRPTTSAAFRRPAHRPAYSVLGHGRWAAAGLPPMRDWHDALRAAIPGILAP